ncbi:MAG: hypothetical protein JRN20_22195 [Nitrososphaerota archaeon]|nr:hypothetical protein [Nitrososphaerota archaeon]
MSSSFVHLIVNWFVTEKFVFVLPELAMITIVILFAFFALSSKSVQNVNR